MISIMLAIIYLAFVSMGLPDAMLGSAWPSIYPQLDVPLSWMGALTMLIASGTVISSLLTDRLLRRLGTGRLTLYCTVLTAAALFGFSMSRSYAMLCLWALPYGLGAGSIDAALNNYVALKFKSRHMSWIHFFWGVGAAAGPYVMGSILTGGAPWNDGYRAVGLIQTAMSLILLLSLPLWKKHGRLESERQSAQTGVGRAALLRRRGTGAILAAFFCYCSMESTAGVWVSSYMTLHRGISAEEAARWASIFYTGITLGRFACGFVTDRVGDRNMVRLGQGSMLAGTLLMLLPGGAMCFAGLILIGLGCAPVYPCLLHQTPENFGAENSQTIMGLQMACAYVGSTLTPPLFGLLAERVMNIGAFPLFLLAVALGMTVLTEYFLGVRRSEA